MNNSTIAIFCFGISLILSEKKWQKVVGILGIAINLLMLLIKE